MLCVIVSIRMCTVLEGRDTLSTSAFMISVILFLDRRVHFLPFHLLDLLIHLLTVIVCLSYYCVCTYSMSLYWRVAQFLPRCFHCSTAMLSLFVLVLNSIDTFRSDPKVLINTKLNGALRMLLLNVQ